MRSSRKTSIYPTSLPELHRTLIELDAAVGGEPGPYVLTDLRWNEGPLFVRYGAFLHTTVLHEGRPVPAICDRRTGELVPDRRLPSFHVPEWVTIPDFLQEQLDLLSSEKPSNLPPITGALHHSNAGGVYTAELNGTRIILKEARPHIGWTPDERDAVTRLIDEEQTLRSLPPGVRAPQL